MQKVISILSTLKCSHWKSITSANHTDIFALTKDITYSRKDTTCMFHIDNPSPVHRVLTQDQFWGMIIHLVLWH